jgi:hypothetical protein
MSISPLVRDRGARVAVVCVATVAVLAGCGGGDPAAPDAAASPAAPTSGAPTQPTPTVTSSGATIVNADVTLMSAQLVLSGSAGTVPGTAEITVLNMGSTAPALTLSFRAVPVRMITLTGDAWGSCDQSDDGTTRTVTCRLDPVAAGSRQTYVYGFRVAFSAYVEGPVAIVTVTPVDARERDPSDNTVELTLCTNGC